MSINYYDSRTGELTPVPGSGSGSHIKDEMIAGYEASNLAANAYSVGEQLIYNGKLYTVISPIAVDDDITGKIAESESLSKQLLGYEKKIWKGTEEAWEALSAEEKAKYTTAIITNDTSDFKVVKIPGEFKGATASTDGTAGMVVVPHAGDQDKVLKGDGSWVEISESQNKLKYLQNLKSRSMIQYHNWKPKNWNISFDLYGDEIWSDGDNIYYSHDSDQYVLDKTTDTWIRKVWNGLTSFYGNYIWSDGNNTYYSLSSNQYVLNKSTDTWTRKVWKGLTSFGGNCIWSDGDNIYYSYESKHYVLDKSTDTWTTKTWNGVGLDDIDGINIWTDGYDIYYTNGTDQYVLDKSTDTWTTKTWNGSLATAGYWIWSDGDNIFGTGPTGGGVNVNKVLDKISSTWIQKDLPFNGNGRFFWTDGNNIYYSYGDTQYVLTKQYI